MKTAWIEHITGHRPTGEEASDLDAKAAFLSALPLDRWRTDEAPLGVYVAVLMQDLCGIGPYHVAFTSYKSGTLIGAMFNFAVVRAWLPIGE